MSAATLALEAPHILAPAYYDRLHAIEEAHGWARGMRALAGELLDPLFSAGRRWRVLDDGCGTGGMLAWLGRYDAAIAGIDVAPDGLRYCQARGGYGLAAASALLLPFRDASFDLVLSADVIQHLPDPPGERAALAEAYRVLRPGGYLFLRTNSQLGMGKDGAARQPDFRRYRRPALRASVMAAGFAVERATYANCLPALLAVARRRLSRAPAAVAPYTGHRVGVRPPERRWIDDTLCAVLRAEAWFLRHTGRELPFGHSLVILARKP